MSQNDSVFPSIPTASPFRFKDIIYPLENLTATRYPKERHVFFQPEIHFSYNPAIFGTPPKINMEPEKKSLEKEAALGNHHFQVPC